MILVIDNYDSFVFNIARYVEELGREAKVARNDRIGIDDILASGAAGLIVSPGPCTPNEAGISTEAVRELSGKLPILGICLGHQCIGQAFGAAIGRASTPMHGRASKISHDGRLTTRTRTPSPARARAASTASESSLPVAMRITSGSPSGGSAST